MRPGPGCNCRYADVGCDKMEQVMEQISGKWKLRILFMVPWLTVTITLL